MKKILLVLTLALLLILTACKAKDETTDVFDMDALKTRIEESADLAENIMYEDGGNIPLDNFYLDYYFSDKAILEGIDDYIMLVSAESKMNEIGVFKITSPEQKERLEQAVITRVQKSVTVFEPYSEEDANIAKSFITGEYKDIFYYIMTPNPTATEELIKND